MKNVGLNYIEGRERGGRGGDRERLPLIVPEVRKMSIPLAIVVMIQHGDEALSRAKFGVLVRQFEIFGLEV